VLIRQQFINPGVASDANQEMSKEKPMETLDTVKMSMHAHPVPRNIIRLLLLVGAACLGAHVSLAQHMPVPYIEQLQPPSVAPGTNITFTINGTGFVPAGNPLFPASVVYYNGLAMTGTLGSTDCTINVLTDGISTQCKVTVTNAFLPVTSVVTVHNPFPMASPQPPDLVSNSVFFPVHSGPTTVSFGTLPTSSNCVGLAAPQSIAVGDFNNDGFLDLVVSDSAHNSIHVCLGKGDGTFTDITGAAGIPTGHNPQGLAVGDFNNDGNLDVAVVNQNDNNVQIFLGDGTGSFFAPAKTYGLFGGVGPIAVAVGDFNGDGALDLAVVNQVDGTNCPAGGPAITMGNGSITFLQGNINMATGEPDGTFSQAQTHMKNPMPPPLFVTTNLAPVCLAVPATAIAVGDFHGQGFLDIVVNNGSTPSSGCPPGVGTVSLLSNTSLPFNAELGGGFIISGPQPFCAGKSPRGLAVGDFNGDGKLDLAVAEFGDNAVTIFIGNGDGTFQPGPNSFALGPGSSGLGPASLAAGDFNSDGILDLAVADQGSSGVSILLGQSNGASPPVANGMFSAAPGSPFSTLDVNNTGQGPASLIAADFNGDGRLDIVTADNTDGRVSVLLQGVNLTISPQNVDFSNSNPPATSSLPPGQPIGVASSAMTVTLTNNGSITLTIDMLQVSPASPNPFDFSIDPMTTNCSATVTMLATGQSCVIGVIFKPTDVGLRQAVVQIVSGNGTVTVAQSVPVDGIGLANPIQLTPATLNFGPECVQTATGCTPLPAVSVSADCPTSPSVSPLSAFIRCVALQNVGTNPLTITSISSSDTTQFPKNDDCLTKSPLAPNGTCTIAVGFAPTSGGPQIAQVAVQASIASVVNFSQILPLAGNGLAPLVSLSSPPLTFANQQVGTSSTVEVVTLSNLGTLNLLLGSFAISPASPDFQIVPVPTLQLPPGTNNCPSNGSLAVSTSCVVGIQFTPSFVAGGSAGRSATLVFLDDNMGKPQPSPGTQCNSGQPGIQCIGMSGTATFPVVGLSTASVGFAGVPVTTRGAPMSFTLANMGTAPLSLYGIADSDSTEFIESDNCPRAPLPPMIPTATQQLAINTFCTITVVFAPSAPAGLRNATLTFSDDNFGSSSTMTLTQVVNLTGTGTDFTLSVAPTSITIAPSKTATYKITLNPIDGFNNPVSFNCAGGPPHSNCFISGMSNGSASVILSTSQGVNHGTFTLTFTATYAAVPPASGTLSHSVQASLAIK
jgi:hypothetical protein